MKKTSLLLALVMLLAILLPCLSIGAAARPIDAFTEVVKPAPSTIRQTTYSFYRAWGVENPVGEWNLFGEDISLSRHNSSITYVENNQAALIIAYNDYDRKTLTELVFADYFTISGQGAGGRTAINQASWDKVTVVVSDDALHWREVGFTVAYHTETSTYVNPGNGEESPVDLYWHLILEETTTAKYFAIHTSETKAWDAQDNRPRLGIILAHDFYYGVNTSGIEVENLGNVRYLYAQETQTKGTVVNATINEDGTLTHGGFQAQAGVFSAWPFDGATKLFPYVEHKVPVSVNEMVIGDVSHWHQLPLYTDYADFEIYYTNDVNGTWTKANVTGSSYDCTQELNGTYPQGMRFVFDETVTAKYFMLYDPAPKANEVYLHGSTFSAVYDPANNTSAPIIPNIPVETDPIVTLPPKTEAPETEAPSTTDAATDSATTDNVTNAPVTEPAGENGGIDTWVWIVIGVAVVAVVVVVVVLTKKKK